MRRVVRPGGRVVPAEPDWASLIIDSVDHTAMEVLVRQANTRGHVNRTLDAN
jgi:hypothetical protein